MELIGKKNANTEFKSKKKQFKSISIIKTKLAIGELVNKRSKLVI